MIKEYKGNNGKVYVDTGERYNLFAKKDPKCIPKINKTGKGIFSIVLILIVILAFVRYFM